jgi:organic radical activating enzyme
MSSNIGLKYSETFYSAQGEGQYIGIPSLWMRFFLCNLQCHGFGQEDPTNPDTYELPFEQIDISHITDVRELPVFDKGCDSSYTWSRKYRHLISTRTVEDGVNELTELLPGGKFIHPKTGQEVHMVFTGGEPLLQPTQPGIIAVLKEFDTRNNFPNFVTVETNGTREISDELFDYIKENYSDVEGREWYWSLSPKLWSTAGEKPKKAIKPEFVGKYAQTGANGQLKFVVNGSKESWEEVETYTQMYRDCGVDYPVWIMGVGGTLEGLKITEADIADEAIDRGYRYSSRVHVHIYGNAIGK